MSYRSPAVQTSSGVALIQPESPIVGTGLESVKLPAIQARSSAAEDDGEVIEAVGDAVQYKDRIVTYEPLKSIGSNEARVI